MAFILFQLIITVFMSNHPAQAASLPGQCGSGTYSRFVQANSATSLKAALAAAQPGDLIQLTDGVYEGRFVLATSGTASSRITVCGSRGAILDGVSLTSGYTFHLKASYVNLVGFSLTRGKNALILDGASYNSISKLSVSNTGNEAIHLRTHSSYNVLDSNAVHAAGLQTPDYGEGIYVGSAKSNWCTYTNCGPDKSDFNYIINNSISGTRAENIDIKEGTTGTVVQGNIFDATDITGANYADSWIDVKGNDVLVKGNTGKNSGSVLLDGYQTHVVVAGWGQRIRFEANRSMVQGDGYAVNVHSKSVDVTVTCDNTSEGARSGLTNISCTEVTSSTRVPASTEPAVVNLASLSAVISSSELRSDHSIDNLFDGCVEDKNDCMIGSDKTALFEMEMDFKSVQNIKSIELFGDANGNWVSEKLDVGFKNAAGDSYQVYKTGVRVLKNDWIVTETAGLSGRYLKIRVRGNSTKNAVQARELRILGSAASSSSEVDTPVSSPEESQPVIPLAAFASSYPGKAVSNYAVKYLGDQSYDVHSETKLDIFTIDPAQLKRTPLVVYIHGGGFNSGDKADAHSAAKAYLENGIAFATVNYRLLDATTPQADKTLLMPLGDSARSIQFIRYHAASLNIDPSRIILVGSSAGASTALWIGLQDDMKVETSSDPVRRQSTRVLAIAVSSTQATVDVYRWGNDPEFKGLYAEGTSNSRSLLKLASVHCGNTGAAFQSYKDLLASPWAEFRKKIDVIGFVDSSDPEVYVENKASATNLLHSYYHADRLYSIAAQKSLSGVFKTPEGTRVVGSGKADSSMQNFIFRKLGK